MKIAVYILVVASLVFGLASTIRRCGSTKTASIEVGILQTASHPALDQVREGFIKALEREVPGVVFRTQNAEGSQAQARAAAKSFHGKPNMKLVFTIGTLATQATLKADASKPLVYAAVSDPKLLGAHGANVVGVSDQIDMAKQVELIKTLLPAARKVGIIMNPSEPNSTAQADLANSLLDAAKIEHAVHAVYSASDVSIAVRQALRNNDVLLAPTDNTVAANMVLIGRMALQEKKPLLMSHTPIEHGALWAMGVDYNAHGEDAALLAVHILGGRGAALSGRKTGDSKPSLIISKSVAGALGLELSPATAHNAQWVN